MSTQIYNAQEAGALAVIVMHTTNSKDSVLLPRKSTKVKYDNDFKIKIPCFTVRKEIGMTLLQLSPSLVGIKRPKDTLGTSLSLEAINHPTTLLPAAQQQPQKLLTDSISTIEQAKITTANQVFNQIGWALAPNPASSEAILQYNFTQSASLNIEIFNELGQLLTNYTLPNTQTGKLSLEIGSWQSGAYTVRLTNGATQEVKRLIVAH